MKQNKLFLGLATMFAAAFAFTSCSSDDAESQSTQQDRTIRLVSTLEKGGTRSTTDPQAGTSLSTSSNLAIWAINTTADPDAALTNGNNEQYTVNGSGNLAPKTAANTMTWPDGATLDFYAYAPYNSGYSYNAANDFSVATDQSTEASYLASDLVLAQATNKTYSAQTPVALEFNHMLSKVNITIKEDANSNVDLADAVVSITNTLPTTTFNPSTGELGVASGSATEITAATIAADLEEGVATSTATACAVVVPQSIAAGTEFIKIVTSDSKTLIGKLSAATTLEGGNSYSMTISVGAITEPVTIVDIELGSATLVQWTDNTIGLTAYGVGDYVLTDGTFMKASAYSTASAADKAKVAGIIFSTTVSSTDAAAGYNAYAMGLNRQKQAFHISTDYPSQMVTDNKINDLADAIADLDGLTRTTTMLASDYYSSLTDDQKTASMINLSWYSTTKSKAISANASAWYLPSFGQIVQILNNLGGANFTTYDFGEGSFTSSSTYTVGDAAALTTMAGNIQAYVTAVGGQNDMFTVGNINYPSSTENGSNADAHYGKVFSINFTSSSGWNFGKALGRTDASNYSVIPVVAVKLPAVAQ